MEKGHIRFTFFGEKLKGEFTLVRLKKGEKNEWLLIKMEDEYAKNYSFPDLLGIPGAEKINNIPRYKPMLATFTDKAFDDEEWIFEIKWDGYRAISSIVNGQVSLYSRNDISFNDKYPEIVSSLTNIPRNMVLDGEIVIVDSEGHSRFQLLQEYQESQKGTLVYFVFDILYFDGYQLVNMPLMERKKILEQALPSFSQVKLSGYIEKNGKEMLEAGKKEKLEGIIGKRKISLYRPGERSREWLKIKTKMRQEVIIAGFTQPRGSRKEIGALVVGIYKDHDMAFAGHVGGGLGDQDLEDLKKKFDKYIIPDSPFSTSPKTNTPVVWLKPHFVAEVEFVQWTKDGHMRQPVFIGLRNDVSPRDVRKEEAEKVTVSGENKLYLLPQNKQGKYSNPDKIYFPDDGIAKKEVMEYYDRISSYILPYLIDRPESLHRFPNGIKEESFWEKNIRATYPDWLKTVEIYAPSEERKIRYLLCQDKKTLLYMANLGCIEINPWNSRVGNYDNPDYAVIDLDPLETAFNKVIITALEVKKILDEIEVSSFCKTTGKTGLHVYIPMGAKYTYKQVEEFSKIIAYMVNRKIPGITSVERNPEKRKRKVYIDYLQNIKGQTLAAPYSLRPVRGALVSTPLDWEELTPNFNPAEFNIHTIFPRLKTKRDLWTGVLDKGIDLGKTLDQIDKKFNNKTI